MAVAGEFRVEEVGREAGPLFARIVAWTFPPLALLGGLIGVLLVETTARISWLAVPGLIGVAALLALVQAQTELSGYPVRVTLRPAGLTLAYPKFVIEAPWEEWTPVARNRMTGGVTLRTRWGSTAGYRVTGPQARRLRAYPARPDWPQVAELFPPEPDGRPPSPGH